jgi:hypothetical protein
VAYENALRREMPSGDYVVAHHWADVGRLLQTRFADAHVSRHVMYYLRVQLREPVRGRVRMLPLKGSHGPS